MPFSEARHTWLDLFMPPGRSSLNSTYLWSFASGLLYAGGTFAMLMVITHAIGAYWGGVFSIALALAQQFLTIGFFSVRNYQVSDTDEVFAFGDYVASRIVTCSLMFAAGLGWMACSGYSRDKTLAFFLLLILKTAEAFSNVLEGRYQQKERLDAACRSVFIKTLLPLALFVLTLMLWKRLFLSLTSMAGFYILLTWVIDGRLIGAFGGLRCNFDAKRLRALLKSCLPLFLNTFLLMFINNAAKYAINAHQSETALTQYSAMFMASFVIALLSSFILGPWMTALAKTYKSGDRGGFARLIGLQLLWVALITAGGLSGTYFLGTALLSRIFGLDLHGFRLELCLLMGGGSLMAVYQIFQFVLVIMRHLTACVVGIALTAALTLLITPPLVARHGLVGASWSYFIAMSVMAAVALLTTVFYFYRVSARHLPITP